MLSATDDCRKDEIMVAKKRFFRALLVGFITSVAVSTLPVSGSLQAMDRHEVRLDLLRREWRLPGLVALVASDRQVILRAVGRADPTGGLPLTPQTRFPAEALTHVFLACLAHQLIEEGRLAPETLLRDRLPPARLAPLPQAGAVSLEQLLGHTSGLPDFLDGEGFWPARRARGGQGFAVEELLGYAAHYDGGLTAGSRPPTPGQYSYAHTNTVLLGALIAQVTGEPVAKTLEARLFRPLGMGLTQVVQEDSGLARSNRDGHSGLDFGFGRIATTAKDLHRFGEALLREGEVLAPDTLFAMLESAGAKEGYGLGLERLSSPWGLAVGHSFPGLGFTAELQYLPEIDHLVVVLANSDEMPELSWEVLEAWHVPRP